MKRRTFILGGGAIGVGSLGLTASAASFVNDVSVASDFRVVEPAVETDIDAETTDENEITTHTWEFTFIEIEEVVTDLIIEYPDGTSFSEVTDDEVTIEFERSNGNLRTIRIDDSEYDDETATFELDTDQEIFGSARIEIEQIENPVAGSYEPGTTFITDSEENTANGELNIGSDNANFEVTIDEVTDPVRAGDRIVVEYTVENINSDPGSQDIEYIVDETVEADEEITLGGLESTSDSFNDYRTDDDDIGELPITVASEDDDASETVTVAGWQLELDPPDQNSESDHTWKNPLVEFEGEVDEITVEYPEQGNQSYEFDGLTEENITVRIEGDEDDEATPVTVLPDDYRGATATFDLDPNDDTTVDGEIIVLIEELENPQPGDYEATITLTGSDDDKSATVDFEVG